MKVMRGLVPAAIALSALLSLSALTACSGRSASETLETAELEEKQNALEHARKLYREVVEKYPGTPEAARASARLEALAAPSTP